MRFPGAVPVLAFTAATAATALAFAPPEVLWLNAGPTIKYPWTAGAGALIGAIVLAGLGLQAKGTWQRAVALVLAGLLVVWSCELFVYRLNVTASGLAQRGLTGSSSIPWRGVTGVELEPRHIAVQGPKETVRIPTHRISPEDRARLERTIARQVREATPSAPR
jgi:hypothetical protein